MRPPAPMRPPDPYLTGGLALALGIWVALALAGRKGRLRRAGERRGRVPGRGVDSFSPGGRRAAG